jgi:PPM family protein phosphatase
VSDRWYYTHKGQTRGPVPGPDLLQLAALGELLPEDSIWGETESQDQAIPAEFAVDFSSLPPPAAKPGKPAAVSRSEPPVSRSSVPKTVIPSAPPPPSIGPPTPLPTRKAATTAEAVPLLPPSSGACRVSVGCATSPGKVRDRNEDHFLVQQCTWSRGEEIHEAVLLAVADGMGGNQSGDQASRLVISTLASAVIPALAGLVRGPSREAGLAALTKNLADALQECNRTVSRVAASDPGCQGMGSTAAVAVIWDGQVMVSHVGDCRVYHLHGDTLTQITRDQTLVARMVELGQLSPEEAARHPARNEVTQAIGKRSTLEPSQSAFSLQRGDWVIVACDGLTAHVADAALQETARASVPSAGYLARRLVDLANEGGGTDNCTVVAAYCY